MSMQYKFLPGASQPVEYVYDPATGIPDATIDPKGQSKSVVFDPATKTTVITEKDSGQWTYRYGASGQLLSKEDPEGNTTSYTYTSDFRELSVTTPGHSTDTAVRLTSFTDYDAKGRVVARTEPVNLADWGLAPEDIASYAQLATLDPPIATAFSTTYDDARFGQIASHTDLRGATPLTTSYTYTSEADAVDPSIVYEVTTVTDPAGKTSVTKLYPDGRIKEMIDGNGQPTTFEYDPATDLLWKIHDPRGITTEYGDYDAYGNARTVTVTDSEGQSRTTTLTFDALGRLATSTQESSAIDANGDPLALYQSEIGYDLAGHRSYVKDANGNETFIENNYLGQVEAVTNALQDRTELTYSGAGCASCTGGVDKLTAVIDANHVNATEPRPATRFAYYQSGALKSETDPLGNAVLYRYYPSGKLYQKLKDDNGDGELDPGDSAILTYTYTTDGQLDTKTDHLTGELTDFDYDAHGRLEAAVNPHISYGFTYYANGWLQTVTATTAAGSTTIRYNEYDGIGQKELVTLFEGSVDERTLDYQYDAQKRLEHLVSGGQSFTFGYDALSRRESLSYPNGLVTTYGYHADQSWLESLVTRDGGGQTLLELRYPEHDLVGNRKQRSEDGALTTYLYDDIYQLTEAQNGASAENYVYDPVGNRTGGPTVKEPEGASYVHNAANQMEQGRKRSYTYDHFGNQSERIISASKKWVLTWDGDNRLVRAELTDNGSVLRTVTFAYDPFGRRIEKDVTDHPVATTTTSAYTYDGEDIVRLVTTTQQGAAAPVTQKTLYLHGPGIDEPLARITDSGPTYYHADGLGSIVAVTDESQSIVQRYRYESFGLPLPQDVQFGDIYAFTGREWDKEIGLYYYRARYYDPMEGRFVSEDPIGFDGGDWNLYRYVGNNSINYVDPHGLERGWGYGGHIVIARLSFDRIYDECCNQGKKIKRTISRNCYSFGLYASIGLPFGKGFAPVLNDEGGAGHCGEAEWEEDSNETTYGGDLGIYGRDSKSKNKWLTFNLGGYVNGYQDCRFSVIKEEVVGCCDE